jgi:hypothetical protein
MQRRPWFPLLVALAGAGNLGAQQEFAVSLNVGGMWTTIPGRVARPEVARGVWGASAELELGHVEIPRLALVARLGYTPERLAPAGPGMTELGAGLRLAVLRSRRIGVSTSLDLEAVRFAATAYNAAVAECGPGLGCPAVFLGYADGWRLGMSLRPTLQIWPKKAVGFQIAPAVRWLGPFDQGGSAGNPVYLSFGVGMVFRLAAPADLTFPPGTGQDRIGGSPPAERPGGPDDEGAAEVHG